MNIWLDDQWDEIERRQPPAGYIPFKTAWEVIEQLKTGNVEAISLDHDLGPEEAGTGYNVAEWIERAAYEGKLKRLKWNVHSANMVGAAKMARALANADRFWDMHERL